MGRIVCLDYGRAKIGLAISDETKRFALPLDIIQCSSTVPKTLSAIQQLLQRQGYKVEKFVIGLPLLLNGSEGEMASEVKAFAAELEKFFSLPVEFIDERLSSAQSDKMLKDLSLSRKKREKFLDSVAATTLLQCYLTQLPPISL